MIAPIDESTAGVVAPSSARVYRTTYASWAAWTADHGVNPLDVNFQHGRGLPSRPRQHQSQQTTRIIHPAHPGQDLADCGLPEPGPCRRLREPEAAQGASHRREPAGRAGTARSVAAEADRLLRVWKGDETVRGKRNRALVAMLLLAGLRREELAALTWADVEVCK
jgi:hypothetical protein